MSGHAGPVTAVDALYIPTNGGGDVHRNEVASRTVVVTASVDSTVKVWTRSEGQGIVLSFIVKKCVRTHVCILYTKYTAQPTRLAR